MRLSAESMANSDLWPGCDQAICDFVFCRGASPLLRGADDLLIACVAVSALLPVAAWFFPITTLTLLPLALMALPHPLGVFAASRALNRRREDESLEELAVLPLRPAALKWLFLLPAASALNASIKPLMLGSVGAWSIACAKLASLPPADTWIAYLLTAFFFLLFISTPIFLILIFLRRFTQMSALIGWRLILSFNPLGVWALAMLIGLRVVGGILLGIIAVLTGVGVAVNYSDVLGERGTLTVLLLSVFAMLALWMQSLALGFRLPPQWAMEDDLLIAERGLQALRPRDDFAEKGRLLGMLLLLLWPWPRYNSEWRVAPHQRDLAKRWRQRNGWEG